MSFGATIRAARRANGYTQRDLADRLGIHFTYLSKLEHDACPPGRDLVRRIARLLDLDPLDLMAAAGMSAKVPAATLRDQREELARRDGLAAEIHFAIKGALTNLDAGRHKTARAFLLFALSAGDPAPGTPQPCPACDGTGREPGLALDDPPQSCRVCR